MVKGVGHIGIVVDDVEAVVARLCRAFDLPPVEIRESAEMKLKVAVVPWGPVELELLENLSEDAPLAAAFRRRGNHVHHFCLISDDLVGDIAGLQGRGVTMWHDRPLRGARGKDIAFIAPDLLGGVPIELSEP